MIAEQKGYESDDEDLSGLAAPRLVRMFSQQAAHLTQNQDMQENHEDPAHMDDLPPIYAGRGLFRARTEFSFSQDIHAHAMYDYGDDDDDDAPAPKLVRTISQKVAHITQNDPAHDVNCPPKA